MQVLAAAPRQGWTTQQVTDLIVATDLTVGFGLDLLDPVLDLVTDISDSVSGGKVHRSNYADIHGTVDLTLSRRLLWGRDRVRPYVLLSSSSQYDDVVDVKHGAIVGVNLCTSPNARESLTGFGVGNVTLTRDNAWAENSSGYSVKAVPTGASTDSFIDLGTGTASGLNGMVADATYTASATLRLAAPQINPQSTPRTVCIFYKVGAGAWASAVSTPAPNDVGDYRLSVTATLPAGVTQAFVRLYNGSNNVNDAVWYDDILIEQSPTMSSYFDGEMLDTDDFEYEWTGTPNVSTSSKRVLTTTRTRLPRVARFNQGVFVLTSPTRPIGGNETTYSVTGYDLLYLLRQPVGDTYVVTAGTTYLQAVKDVLTASGVVGTVLLDGSKGATVLPVDMVWALSESSAVIWLGIINDLLDSISYQGLWADQDGNFHSGPYSASESRAAEWTFDVTNQITNIVGLSRTETEDTWSAPNYWRFVRKGMTYKPTEGDGIYTYTNQSTGASSVASIGRVVKAPTVFLDAADQASLVAQGDQIISAALSNTRVLSLTTGPFPIAGHFDQAYLIDPQRGSPVRVQARSWEMDLYGGDVVWEWEVLD